MTWFVDVATGRRFTLHHAGHDRLLLDCLLHNYPAGIRDRIEVDLDAELGEDIGIALDEALQAAPRVKVNWDGPFYRVVPKEREPDS